MINKHMLGAHAKELPESQQKKLNIMTCEKCGYKGTKNRMNRHLESCLKSPHRSRYKGSEFQCQTCKNANVNIFLAPTGAQGEAMLSVRACIRPSLSSNNEF